MTGCAIATVSTHPKVYSNGLDFKNFKDVAEVKETINKYTKVLADLIEIKAPTIAILNGFALAGGCFLALVHDFRIALDSDYHLKLPEQEFGAPIPGSSSFFIS